jgi:ABC-2 type transport system permease protein
VTVTRVDARPTAGPATPPLAGRVRSMADFYRTTARTAVISQFQYRASNYLYMIGMVAEPVVYLVVWSSIARENGGQVEGYTPARFAAYYIVWTLVRNINIVFTPYGWEGRIKEGELSGDLLKPIHPIHRDLAFFAGWKLVVIVLWLPIAAVLGAVFRPSLSPSVIQVVVFAVAIWGAYLIRSLNMWSLGLITLWTTRVSAIFELYWIAEMLLSGRIVPIGLLPHWAQTLSFFLPFRWCFGFPITALVGPVTNHDLLVGLGMQLVWIAFGTVVMQFMWRAGVKRYSAVGG